MRLVHAVMAVVAAVVTGQVLLLIAGIESFMRGRQAALVGAAAASAAGFAVAAGLVRYVLPGRGPDIERGAREDGSHEG